MIDTSIELCFLGPMRKFAELCTKKSTQTRKMIVVRGREIEKENESARSIGLNSNVDWSREEQENGVRSFLFSFSFDRFPWTLISIHRYKFSPSKIRIRFSENDFKRTSKKTLDSRQASLFDKHFTLVDLRSIEKSLAEIDSVEVVRQRRADKSRHTSPDVVGDDHHHPRTEIVNLASLHRQHL